MENSSLSYRELNTRFQHDSENHEENNLELDEGNEKLCDACTLPIFSTPFESYEDGRRLLHKCCANFPTELEHTSHPTRHLRLHKYVQSRGIVICDKCGEECKGSFYQCPDCKFTLDVLCANVTIKILHRSHKHELVLFHSKMASFTCGACEMERNGESYFYFCSLCDFWIHQSCTLLPNAIHHKNHDIDQQQQHPLCLTYSLPRNSVRFKDRNRTCSLCHGELVTNSGVYFCTRCEYAAHVRCAIADPASYEPVPSRDAVAGSLRLPMENENSSALSRILGMRSYGSSSGATTDELFKEELHHHPLIRHDEGGPTPSSSLCNACIRPIVSPPYYTCPQCPLFFLHTYCANNLPLHLQHPAHRVYPHAGDCKDRPLALIKARSGYRPISDFRCHACYRRCNGFTYGCEECPFKLDVECALLPEAITHKAHRNTHILFLSYSYLSYYSDNVCACCRRKTEDLYYQCCSCPNFGLHARCALLPTTVVHKFDRHPLKLTSPTRFSTTKKDEDFCEICEESMIDTEGWFYHCEKCVQSFHIDCIPCVGELSKIKFGGEIRVKGHDCPLTSVRLLTSYSHTCFRCKGIIQGKEEGIAYACCKCHYWMHEDCAEAELDMP